MQGSPEGGGLRGSGQAGRASQLLLQAQRSRQSCKGWVQWRVAANVRKWLLNKLAHPDAAIGG